MQVLYDHYSAFPRRGLSDPVNDVSLYPTDLFPVMSAALALTVGIQQPVGSPAHEIGERESTTNAWLTGKHKQAEYEKRGKTRRKHKQAEYGTYMYPKIPSYFGSQENVAKAVVIARAARALQLVFETTILASFHHHDMARVVFPLLFNDCSKVTSKAKLPKKKRKNTSSDLTEDESESRVAVIGADDFTQDAFDTLKLNPAIAPVVLGILAHDFSAIGGCPTKHPSGPNAKTKDVRHRSYDEKNTRLLDIYNSLGVSKAHKVSLLHKLLLIAVGDAPSLTEDITDELGIQHRIAKGLVAGAHLANADHSGRPRIALIAKDLTAVAEVLQVNVDDAALLACAAAGNRFALVQYITQLHTKNSESSLLMATVEALAAVQAGNLEALHAPCFIKSPEDLWSESDHEGDKRAKKMLKARKPDGNLAYVSVHSSRKDKGENVSRKWLTNLEILCYDLAEEVCAESSDVESCTHTLARQLSGAICLLLNDCGGDWNKLLGCNTNFMGDFDQGYDRVITSPFEMKDGDIDDDGFSKSVKDMLNFKYDALVKALGVKRSSSYGGSKESAVVVPDIAQALALLAAQQVNPITVDLSIGKEMVLFGAKLPESADQNRSVSDQARLRTIRNIILAVSSGATEAIKKTALVELCGLSMCPPTAKNKELQWMNGASKFYFDKDKYDDSNVEQHAMLIDRNCAMNEGFIDLKSGRRNSAIEGNIAAGDSHLCTLELLRAIAIGDGLQIDRAIQSRYKSTARVHVLDGIFGDIPGRPHENQDKENQWYVCTDRIVSCLNIVMENYSGLCSPRANGQEGLHEPCAVFLSELGLKLREDKRFKSETMMTLLLDIPSRKYQSLQDFLFGEDNQGIDMYDLYAGKGDRLLWCAVALTCDLAATGGRSFKILNFLRIITGVNKIKGILLKAVGGESGANLLYSMFKMFQAWTSNTNEDAYEWMLNDGDIPDRLNSVYDSIPIGEFDKPFRQWVVFLQPESEGGVNWINKIRGKKPSLGAAIAKATENALLLPTLASVKQRFLESIKDGSNVLTDQDDILDIISYIYQGFMSSESGCENKDAAKDCLQSWLKSKNDVTMSEKELIGWYKRAAAAFYECVDENTEETDSSEELKLMVAIHSIIDNEVLQLSLSDLSNITHAFQVANALQV